MGKVEVEPGQAHVWKQVAVVRFEISRKVAPLRSSMFSDVEVKSATANAAQWIVGGASTTMTTCLLLTQRT